MVCLADVGLAGSRASTVQMATRDLTPCSPVSYRAAEVEETGRPLVCLVSRTTITFFLLAAGPVSRSVGLVVASLVRAGVTLVGGEGRAEETHRGRDSFLNNNKNHLAKTPCCCCCVSRQHLSHHEITTRKTVKEEKKNLSTSFFFFDLLSFVSLFRRTASSTTLLFH